MHADHRQVPLLRKTRYPPIAEPTRVAGFLACDGLTRCLATVLGKSSTRPAGVGSTRPHGGGPELGPGLVLAEKVTGSMGWRDERLDMCMLLRDRSTDPTEIDPGARTHPPRHDVKRACTYHRH